MNQSFTIFPAIDLREGKVVRLMEGDPDRKIEYSSSPGDTARRWLDAGASWLHVINLDGAFGEDTRLNLQALDEIVMVVEPYGARIQFGGGLRSPETLDNAFQAGIERAILGTWVVQQPEILGKTLSRWGQERLAVSLDARGSEVQVRGWQEGTGLDLFHLAEQFASQGLRWLVYTDIGRDGMKTGFNSQTTIQLAQQSGLQVIASGGVRSSEDITRAKRSGLAGIILGRALYEGNINLAKAIEEYQSQ